MLNERRYVWIVLAASLAVLTFLVPPRAGAAAPAELWRVPEDGKSGSHAGQVGVSSPAVAVDPADGNVYVLDETNHRVDEFTAFGVFVKAWGWGVATGAEALEACGPGANPPTLTCRGGRAGDGPGELMSRPNEEEVAPTGLKAEMGGIALGEDGSIYVADTANHRIQRYAPNGSFELMWGKGVEEGPDNPGDVCTAADLAAGDTCGAGVAGPGEGEIQSAEVGSRLIVADGDIYLGDTGRIEKYSPGGTFIESISLPSPLAGNVPFDVATDRTGGFWVTCACSPGRIFKLSGSGSLETEIAAVTEDLGDNARMPITLGDSGEIFVGIHRLGEKEEPIDVAEVLAFASDGSPLLTRGSGFAQTSGVGSISHVTALASDVVTASGEQNVYAVTTDGSTKASLGAFGPGPDKWTPPLRAPEIVAQSATLIKPESAKLGGRINPRFWVDTSYWVEYGTGRCSEGGCQTVAPTPPGNPLGAVVSNSPESAEGIVVTGLEPGTTYHYRLVAQSTGSGGKAVRGVGGTVEVDGAESTFTTSRPVPSPETDCPNQAFRTGPSAALPDCRAYELISPIEKNNLDILTLPNFDGVPSMLDQASSDGDSFTYTTSHGFGDAVGAAYDSQFLAERGPGGWVNRGITPPQGISSQEPGLRLEVEYRAFSPDLCSGFLMTTTNLQLAPGALKSYFNLYRRDECGAAAYEALSTLQPPPGTSVGDHEPVLQAISADGHCAVFTYHVHSDQSKLPLYEGCDGEGEFPVGILPSGVESPISSAGSPNSGEPAKTAVTATSVSSDGSRIFWSDAFPEPNGSGNLYVRTNAGQSESAHLHGVASGTANLIGAAECEGTVAGSTITELEGVKGGFAVGQQVEDSAGEIPPGTTVAAVEEDSGHHLVKLTLSQAASGPASADTITGLPSKVITGVHTLSGAFQVGQEISDKNATTASKRTIPYGTTIIGVDPGAGTLTLSAAPTTTGSEEVFASSPCTEADKACTVEVPNEGMANARFWGADPTGSRAIFSAAGELKEFALESRAARTIAGGMLGVLGVSEDAERVYFISSQVLARANPQGAAPTAGGTNLYLYDATQTGTKRLKFIGGLELADASQAGGHELSAAALEPYKRLSRVSADGRSVVFMSAANLTGYENIDARSGERDRQVYLYDEADERVVCVSCSPSGSQPEGRPLISEQAPTSIWATALIPEPYTEVHAPGVISQDGSRVFFDSYEELLPQDENSATDVYEWEAVGSGEGATACTAASPRYEAADEGCLSLISSGTSPNPSELLEASSDGGDVFFSTSQSLVADDPGLVDIYDARVDGGFPTTSKSEPCSGEACQQPAAPPSITSPASGTPGEGNPPAVRPKCPKRKRAQKKAGRWRCVAKRPHKHHPKKAQHRGGHRKSARHGHNEKKGSAR